MELIEFTYRKPRKQPKFPAYNFKTGDMVEVHWWGHPAFEIGKVVGKGMGGFYQVRVGEKMALTYVHCEILKKID